MSGKYGSNTELQQKGIRKECEQSRIRRACQSVGLLEAVAKSRVTEGEGRELGAFDWSSWDGDGTARVLIPVESVRNRGYRS